MYTVDLQVRYSECDCTGHAGISNILDYLQDICNFHADSLGMGVEYQEKNQVAWVLSSWQVDICRYPSLGQQIKVSTWPYEFRGFYGLRNFQIVSETGEMLVKAASVWVLMDTNQKRPTKLTREMLERYQIEPKLEMDYLGRKVPDFNADKKGEAFLVPRHFIDMNQHMNNANYILLAEQFLPETAVVEQIWAEYKKSAMQGEMVYPEYCLEKHCLSVKLKDAECEAYALLQMRLKENV